MGAEAAPIGLSGVSPQKLWAHAAKLSPSAPRLAVARELGVIETVAQQAPRLPRLPPYNFVPQGVRLYRRWRHAAEFGRPS
jgi:hypothetical protein